MKCILSILSIFFLCIISEAQTLNTDTAKEKPVQYRRGVYINNNYQSYRHKYFGKNLTEEKKRAYPLNYSATTDGNKLSKATAGTGTWTELNPKVPRVDYLCIHFANIDTGWAVGVEGTIIRTTDGGKKWETIERPVNEILLNINSWKNIVIITGFNGTVLRSEDYGLTWQQPQLPNSITSDLWRVEMVNDSVGWISGKQSTLLKTTNSGKTWEKVETGFDNFNYWFVSFYNEKWGYIAGDSGKILRTEDFGNTWEELNIGDNKELYTLTVFDSLRVVAGGQQGRVAYTKDGGKTWGLSIGGGLVNAMAFVNDSLGYTIGSYESAYYITTNGGVTWSSTGHHAPLKYGGNWIEFINDTLGYIAGNYLRLNFTTDKGYRWNNLFINDDINDIFFINDTTGFICSDFSVFKTSDGGKNWLRLKGLPYYLNTICFIDPLNGFIGGPNHSIYATTDGGLNWEQKTIYGLTDSSSNEIQKFFFLTDTIGYANSLTGIFRTTNSGLNWKQISTIGSGSLQFFTPSTGYNILGSSFFVSLDSGKTWKQKSELSDECYAICFTDSLSGFAVGFNQLFQTTDGGGTWLQVPIAEFGYGNLSIFTKQHIMLASNKIYESVDGGVEWNDITEEVGSGFGKMFAVNPYIGYAGGALGLILKYKDSSIVSIKTSSTVLDEPKKYSLFQNYPNPF